MFSEPASQRCVKHLLRFTPLQLSAVLARCRGWAEVHWDRKPSVGGPGLFGVRPGTEFGFSRIPVYAACRNEMGKLEHCLSPDARKSYAALLNGASENLFSTICCPARYRAIVWLLVCVDHARLLRVSAALPERNRTVRVPRTYMKPTQTNNQ